MKLPYIFLATILVLSSLGLGSDSNWYDESSMTSTSDNLLKDQVGNDITIWIDGDCFGKISVLSCEKGWLRAINENGDTRYYQISTITEFFGNGKTQTNAEGTPQQGMEFGILSIVGILAVALHMRRS